MKLKLSHFDFDLPPELLATEPILNRDESKMMVVHRDSGQIEHKKFKDILDYFTEDDVMKIIDKIILFNLVKIFFLFVFFIILEI